MGLWGFIEIVGCPCKAGHNRKQCISKITAGTSWRIRLPHLAHVPLGIEVPGCEGALGLYGYNIGLHRDNENKNENYCLG